MLTLKQILAATPERIRLRAMNQCYGTSYALPRNNLARKTATRAGGYIVEDESGKYREFKFRVRCTDGPRKVAVRFHGPLNVNTRVWVWCSCPYFKYHCEVALTKRGSSSVVQSNGQRPRFTNPHMEPRCCKHVYLGVALALRRRKPGRDKEMGTLNQPTGAKQRRQTEREVWSGDVLRPAKDVPAPIDFAKPAPIDFGD